MSREEYISRTYEFAHKKNRRFTDQQVHDIRSSRSQGEAYKSIAARHGVHVRTIEKIISYETYAT